MTQTFSEPRLVCRPALASDTADVLEFTKDIFDGHDYVPSVWQDWFDDPQGLLAVAQYGPHAVGMAKITLLSRGQWWLEGLRVDPKFQGLKIGSHIHEYMDAWWLQHCDGVLRLVTSSARVQVHHLSQRTGYVMVGEVIGYEAGPLAEPSSGFEAVPPSEVGDAARFVVLHQNPLSSFMDSGRQFSSPDEPALLDKAQEQRLFWWRRHEALLTYWVDEEERTLGLGLVACDLAHGNKPGLLAELLLDVRRFAAGRNFKSVLWHVPVGPDLQVALKAAGFATDWDDSGYIFEKRHPAR
jgi:GNAT superfamily N-acetyltransferase